MTKYYPYGVSLSKGQLEKLSRAYNNNSAITIRLARNELFGPHELMLTKTQINKLRKAMSQGTGSDIKISKTQIRKAVRQGGSLWGSLINLGSKLLPMAMPLAKKAIAPLATGALSGLASLGVDKIFGKGQRGGFLIPMEKIAQLVAFKHLLTTGQKKDILKSFQTSNGLVIRPTKKQQGGVFRNSISKANPRLSIPSSPSLFITIRRLVRHKASACLNSSILNEYTTAELTKEFE